MPKFDELSVKNIYPHKEKDARFMAFFPDRRPKDRWPDRTYFFAILNTLEPDYVSTIIAQANKARNSA